MSYYLGTVVAFALWIGGCFILGRWGRIRPDHPDASASSVQAGAINLEYQRTGFGINSPTPEVITNRVSVLVLGND